MIHRRVNLSVVCLGVALSGTCFASDMLYSPTAHRNPFYVDVFGGATKMTDSQDTENILGTDYKFTKANKVGYDAGLAAGYRLPNDFRAELAISHFQSNADTLKEGSTKFNASGETQVTPLMLNGYYDIMTQPSNVIVPYVGAGLGGAYVDENIRTKNQYWKGIDSVFAYQGIVGVGFRITPQLTASVDYRYFATEEVSVDILGLAGLGTVTDNIAIHVVNAGLAYYFG